MTMWQNGDVIRCSARLRAASGDDIVNVFHWKLDITDPVDDGYAIGLMAQAVDDLYDTIQPSIPGDVGFVDLDFANITQDLVYGAMLWPSQLLGGGSGDTMPEQNCGLVVGRTNAPHAIGRKFLGPFIEAANLDGVWYSTLVTMLGLFADAYGAAISLGLTGDALPGVPKFINKILVAFNLFYETYSTNQVYTQRRRRRGVGA